MGSETFSAAYRDFLSAYTGVYSEGMMAELRRRYPKIGRQMEGLFEKGEISAMDPAEWTAEDVKAYVRFQRMRGLKPNSIAHDISAIANLCAFCGNSRAVTEARARYPLLFPRRDRDRLPVIERPQFDIIRSHADSLDKGCSPTRVRAYAEVMFAFGAGTRTEELQHIRKANIGDGFRTVFLDFVKGHETYGKPRLVPIRPDCLHAILLWASMESSDSPYLFPSRSGGPLTAMQLTRDRLRVVSETGVTFDYRACRRTYAQYILDEGAVSVEELAVVLGHSSSKTTEASYARPRNDRVVAKLVDKWGV